MTTFNTGNPLGSTDVYDRYDNSENLDNFSNGPLDAYPDRFGVSRQSLQGIRNASQYVDLGPYAAGLVFTSRNQVFSYLGNFYAPGPAITLPYTTTGAGAAEIANFRNVGDAVLRGDLADPVKGAGIIAYDQDETYPDGTVGAALKKPDLTLIRDGLRRVLSAIMSPGANISGVITGDSLSFNGFGYPGGWPVSGAGYATANPFGLSSWAHLTRDMFTTANEAFTPIASVDFDTSAAIYPGNGNQYDWGLNGRTITFNFDAGVTTSLTVRHTYSGPASIIVSYAPLAEAVTFDVDGVSYSTLSPDGKYQSRGYLVIPCATKTTVINNVVAISGPNANLVVYGTGDVAARVPALTGKGAYTSAQILAEYATLVGAYSPDYIFYIIGANDIGLGVPVSTFKANVATFIDNAKTAKPNCEIVLISPPPSTSYTRAVARTYITAMRELAESEGVSVVDLHTQLEQIDPVYYRFDNIHFNTAGDTLVFSILKDLCFPGLPIEQEKLTPVRELQLGLGGYFYKQRQTVNTVYLVLGVSITSAPIGIQPQQVPSATYTGAGATSRVIITPPPGFVIASVQSLNPPVATGPIAEIVGLGSPSPRAVTVAARQAGAYVEMANTGQFLLVSYHRG